MWARDPVKPVVRNLEGESKSQMEISKIRRMNQILLGFYWCILNLWRTLRHEDRETKTRKRKTVKSQPKARSPWQARRRKGDITMSEKLAVTIECFTNTPGHSLACCTPRQDWHFSASSCFPSIVFRSSDVTQGRQGPDRQGLFNAKM